MTQYHCTLDLSRLHCPTPLQRTKATLAQMERGQVLNVIGTDPVSPKEFQIYAHQSGHEVISLVETDNKFHCLIRKG